MTSPLQVLYVYRSPRNKLLEGFQRGKVPLDFFYGLPLMDREGIRARFTDVGFRRTPLHYLGLLAHWLWVRLQLGGFNLGQVLQLKERIGRCDLVFATTDSVGLPLGLLRRLRWIRRPVVGASIGFAERFSQHRSALRVALSRACLRGLNCIICYSEADLVTFREVLHIPAERTVFIPLGIDDEYFVPRGDEQDDGYVLSVGADLRRDWALLLDVAKQLPARFVIVCRKGTLGTQSIPDNVEVRYDLPIAEVRELYAGAACVVVTIQRARQVSGQTVVLQAMAMGKAVIATRTAAFTGYGQICHGKHCLFVPVGNREALRAAIHRLLAEASLRRKLGTNARALIEAHYSAPIYARNLAHIFHSVVKAASLGDKE